MSNTEVLTLYIASKKINKFMKDVGLCEEGKVFISKTEEICITTKTNINEAYVHRIIDASRKDKDIWVPAILRAGILYVAPEINQISDGKKWSYIDRE